MNKKNIDNLIKETVSKELLKEIVDLTHLHDGISTSTEVGQSWMKLMHSLESIINEVQEFPSQYPSNRHGPTPNVAGAMMQLDIVVKVLGSIKPVILGMDQIELKDS